MARNTELTERDFQILNARALCTALRKGLEQLKQHGLKEADIRAFEAVIAEAERHNKLDEIGAQVLLDQARHDTRQRLGDQRRWSMVVARGPDGVDSAAWKALKLDLEFPNDDGALASYMKGLPAAMRKYNAGLTLRGFGRERQQALLDSYAEFVKLSGQVVAEKSKRTADSSARKNAFAKLASYARHYRELGLAAFYGTTGEVDFKRVSKAKRPAKKLALVPAPAELSAAKKTTGI